MNFPLIIRVDDSSPVWRLVTSVAELPQRESFEVIQTDASQEMMELVKIIWCRAHEAGYDEGYANGCAATRKQMIDDGDDDLNH